MKKNFCLALFLAAIFAGFCFDWPQKIESSADLRLFFAQPFGGNFSTGLGFAKEDNVYAGSEAEILAVIRASDSIGQFDSTLGNAVVAIDGDGIMTVYGNLASLALREGCEKIGAGELVGASGHSAWQGGGCGAEFQMLDAKNRCALNPQSLLPQIEMKRDILIRQVSLKSAGGKTYDIGQNPSVPLGKYGVFFARPAETAAFKTQISLNGEKIEAVSYDMLFLEGEGDSRLCASGARARGFDEVFQNGGMQFLGEVSLSRGKSTLRIVAADAAEKSTIASYVLDVY